MTPKISIAIPTYNRAEILEYTLNRLISGMDKILIPYEIIVSDNCSTDETPNVVLKFLDRKNSIKYFKRFKNDIPGNFFNAFRKSAGEYIVYMADDDAIIPEVLSKYLHVMDANKSIGAIYADWIAYDDENNIEINRKFKFKEDHAFEPCQKLKMLDFILDYQVVPEIGIYRSSVALHNFNSQKIQYPWLYWLYGIARDSSILFTLEPWYRENRGLKKQFRRTHWANVEMGLQYVGEELRLGLENLAAMIMLDAGLTKYSDKERDSILFRINRMCHDMLQVEINRAMNRHDWIMAVELKRRMVLNYGLESEEKNKYDLFNITIPAACQELVNIAESVVGIKKILFYCFDRNEITSLFKNLFPNICCYDVDCLIDTNPEESLLVVKSQPDLDAIEKFKSLPGHVVSFEKLLNRLKIGYVNINV